MIGNNTLELNEATMKVALQNYFDTVLYREGQSPVVEGIIADTKMTTTFNVNVSERKQGTLTAQGQAKKYDPHN